MSVVTSKIYNRIKGKGRGWVFGPADFFDIGSRDAVDQVLSRLVKHDKIRRLGRGVYDFPKSDDLIGVLSPASADVAKVIVKDDVIFHSGATAANLLGFSRQVPVKTVFYSNKTSKIFSVGKYDIKIKRARIHFIRNASDTVNLFVQALSYLGKNSVGDDVIKRSVKVLSDSDIKALKRNMSALPSWLCDIIHKIDDVKYGKISATELK